MEYSPQGLAVFDTQQSNVYPICKLGDVPEDLVLSTPASRGFKSKLQSAQPQSCRRLAVLGLGRLFTEELSVRANALGRGEHCGRSAGVQTSHQRTLRSQENLIGVLQLQPSLFQLTRLAEAKHASQETAIALTCRRR